MPKLLFLVTEDWYFVSHRLELGRKAKDMGYEVVVATRCADHAQAIESAGLRVVPLELSRRGIHPWTLIKEVLRVRALYKKEQPDIVHHVALKPVVVGGLASKLLHIKHVVSAISGMGFLFTDLDRAFKIRRVLEWFFPSVIGHGFAIVQNPEDFSNLKRMGIKTNQIRLIPGAGVDLEAFRVRPEPTGAPVVMLPSRMLWDKGVGEFVVASRELKGQGLQARFVLVGDPDPDNPASVSEADLRAWNQEGIVEWWGRRDDMPATLAEATIVCLPSYREGMPKVLLEAMACGRACISTDAPGCRDAVRHEDNGLLVPIKDAHALAIAIRRLLENPDERMKMSIRGRSRAEDEFSQERINDATLELYKELFS